MSLNPLNELKRRLDDDSMPLPKRFCLARNVVLSNHFPTAPKERVVADWLDRLLEKNKLTGNELKGLIGWLNDADDLTAELKCRLIQILSQYVQKNIFESDDVPHIITFLENGKIASQLTQQIDDFFSISVTILQHLIRTKVNNFELLSQKVLNNITKFHKECKKKLEFIETLLNGQNLETIFLYLDYSRDSVVDICKNTLFPINKKSFFVSLLKNMIRKDNIDDLMAEKGDNIQSVLVTMKAFFAFPKNRTSNDQKFICDFIDMFVSCFRKESQLVFAFYIMVANTLNMDQSYLCPAMKMPPITFEENNDKIKRNLFLKMLETLHRNEVDINVRLTDTLGEKVSKVETKKNFISFLQTLMLGQLNLESKLDKDTLQIVKTAMKLDPVLIEKKIDQILPPIMTAKKSNRVIIESYTEMMNLLLEIIFKLGRGISFLSQILPDVKVYLEACNNTQFELKQKLQERIDSGTDNDKLKSKIIIGSDIFPRECVDLYGKWSSELLFRQDKELLISLQKDFEVHCLIMLEAGFVSPSIITLASVLSAILSSVLHHNKMADHSAPIHIAEEFWTSFEQFETECVGKFGECLIKLSYDPQLTLSFLQLCLSCSHLKLLKMKYSHTKLSRSSQGTHTSSATDLSALLPCLDSQQWMAITAKVKEGDALDILAMQSMMTRPNEGARSKRAASSRQHFYTFKNQLLLAKTIAINLQNPDVEVPQDDSNTKTYLIKQLSGNTTALESNVFATTLFWHLDKVQLKQLAKALVKLFLSNPDNQLITHLSNNRLLLNAVVLETAKVFIKSLKNLDGLSKELEKSNCDFIHFAKEFNMKDYIESVTLNENQDGKLSDCIEIFKHIPLHALEENYQLVAIFLLLATKKCCQMKKLRKYIDHIMESIFELSAKHPDLYKLFPLDYIFFDESNLVNLLTLKIKTSNNLIIIKSALESAVKKVKTDDGIVKNIVETLLRKQANKNDGSSSIEYFGDPVFQISCILLPLIAKERKVITNSVYRTTLASLQEKLHESLLDCFKNIEYTSTNLPMNADGNTDGSMVVSESFQATLNAMGAYSLTLSKCCETNDAEEMRRLDYLNPGLEFFVNTAISSIEASTRNQHLESSIQLLNVTLRHMKKLETHTVFQNKDIFIRIWKSVVARLLVSFELEKRLEWSDDLSLTVRLICELVPVEQFNTQLVTHLDNLTVIKAPPQVQKEESPSSLTSVKVSKFLWTQCLKANLTAPKCVALSKLLHKMCKNTRLWLQRHYENQDVVFRRKMTRDDEKDDVKSIQVDEKHDVKSIQVDEKHDVKSIQVDEKHDVKSIQVNHKVCEMLRIYLDTVAEAVLAAKKISLDYKCLDCIFELLHLLHCIMGRNTMGLRCEVPRQGFCSLFEGCLSVLNNLLVSREELLEDRWPCYLQCYRALVHCLCERATSDVISGANDEKLADIAHKIEKLTQSITKRKKHVSRIAAYSVADLCSCLERTAPTKMVRQHLENSIALLLQASDTSFSAAFLRRALVGLPGHITMTNMYTLYKRYHKYVGNS